MGASLSPLHRGGMESPQGFPLITLDVYLPEGPQEKKNLLSLDIFQEQS